MSSKNSPIPEMSGSFPEHGEYSCRFWAALFECEPETVSNGVAERNIPHRVYFGRVKWVEAEEMRKAFPKLLAAIDAASKKTRQRKQSRQQRQE